jgi:hypothetical protein
MEQPALPTSPHVARTLAFLGRAFGITPHIATRGNEEVRAGRFLARLQAKGDLAIQIALADLRHHRDLLYEEAALKPNGLALQALVIELASRHPQAADLVPEMLSEPPLARLFTAILAETHSVRATKARIEFGGHTERMIKVLYCHPTGCREGMTVPSSLREPFLSIVKRAERLGYDAIRPYLQSVSDLPAQVGFSWLSESSLELLVGTQAVQGRQPNSH